MKVVSDNLRTPNDVARVAEEMLSSLIIQNVRYVEFDCALYKYMLLGHSLKSTVKALKHVVKKLREEYDFEAKMVANLIREHGPGVAYSLVEQILDLSDNFIVGIGLSGDETVHPAPLFMEAFELAKKAGLRRVVHAGEAVGPESVWNAIKWLGAERIDHGTRSREDAALVHFLKEKQIPLTQCITSNVRLGVVNGIDDHPFREFYDQGLLVTLNTDDPEVFHTTLTSEYLLASTKFGFNADDLETIMLNGIRASFIPEDSKPEKIGKIRQEITSLRKELRI
jgi:adenosine deaminase